MRITNLNPGDDIGASAWLVEIDGHRILLDAGTHPRHEGRAALPLYDQVAGLEVDAIALSHCHHDHCGSLPVALRHFPRARVMMTEASYFIVERVLHNSVNVMKSQRTELGIAEYPLYHHREVDELAHLFQGFKYRREVEWAVPIEVGERSLPTLEFFDAGHVLGSSGILVRGRKESLFYTGDVCFGPQTILNGARFEDVRADVLLMETTRGSTPTPSGWTREAEMDRLIAAINRALEGHGSVLLPVFALGRTQEMLALLALAMQSDRLPRRPVFIGGLGRVFTEIYDLESHRVDRQHPDLSLHEALNLTVLRDGDVDRMNLGGGKLFVCTAGMMSEHTAAHDLAVRMAGDARQSVFFVGYADPNSPGGRFKASQPGVPFHFSDSAEKLTRECTMETFDLTAHAQRDELADFAVRLDPRTIVLGHGDPDSRDWMEATLRERGAAHTIHQPQPGAEVQA
ncbi:MAG: exonuclease [Verrucomicrobiales bacterium]|nr:exonuclease [Verrucomicrobiales bacterium]|tara:strand:+ start:8068 stop:9441 length:1374 start_codon:yes stop_codon:yes gene_type:complete